MTNWLLKISANKLVYIFYLPWVLFLLIPFTPFYGDSSQIIIPIVFIGWLQMLMYFYFTVVLMRKLLLLDLGDFMNVKFRVFTIYSFFNILILSFLCFVLLSFQLLDIKIVISLFFFYLILEIFRIRFVAKLIVSLEKDKIAKLKDYIFTLYLLMNPHIGIWTIHKRLKELLERSRV